MASKEPRIGNVGEIATAIRLAAGRDNAALGRTVFLIGAGCSKSAGIPLVPEMARELVVKLATALQGPADALKEAESAYRWLLQGGKISDCQIGEQPIDTAANRAIDWSRVYDVLFAGHYRTPDHAREIFSQFVERAEGRVNWAHLCLGELAKQRLISTVITTNFLINLFWLVWFAPECFPSSATASSPLPEFAECLCIRSSSSCTARATLIAFATLPTKWPLC